MLNAEARGRRVIEGSRALLVKGRCLSRVCHLLYREPRVYRLWKTLTHVEILLWTHWVLIHWGGNGPNGWLQVVLRRKPARDLLTVDRIMDWSTILMGHIEPWSRLHRSIKALWTRTFKPHWAHLIQRGFEAHWPLDLSRARPRSHVVIMLITG